MRIGLIGCGKIGARHLDAYQKLSDVEIIVADEDQARAKHLAEQWQVPSLSPEQLLEEPLEAIDVCVPSWAHKDWINRSLKAGFHVFCEKPLSLSLQDGLEIRDAARAAERNVIVGYLYRYHPAFRFAKETLDHGIIGTPYLAIARLGGRGAHQAWKHDASRGGGVIFEMMVHMLDLLSWLLGPLSEGKVVFEDLLLPRRQIQGETVEVTANDCSVVALKAGGIQAICQSDLGTPAFMNYVEVQGTNGSLMASILDFLPTMVYCNEPRVLFDRGHNFRRFETTNLFVKELGNFVETVRSGESNEWSLLESLELARFIESLSSPGSGSDG